jgi:release factor glutamine methyltransferase
VRHVRGLDLVVLPGVLDPALFFSSEVLVDGIRALVRPGDVVLDLGTGCGIGALAAVAEGAARAIAVDVDPVAVRCARVNALLNGADDRVEVRQGDLWDAVAGERFDLVAFNPPWLAGTGASPFEGALLDPGTLPERFADGLAAHLGPTGSGLLVLSTTGRARAYHEVLVASGFSSQPVVARDRGSETLTAWMIRLHDAGDESARAEPATVGASRSGHQ